jgi:HEPN domain-containing protein
VPSRQELKALARLRLREAEALYNVGLYDGAAYLAGYAVEMALKARICRLLGLLDYPSTGALKPTHAVHDLDQLLLLAGLRPRLNPANAALFANWSVAQPWKPDRRYTAQGTYSQQDALDILNAIRDPHDGILRWIARYW